MGIPLHVTQWFSLAVFKIPYFIFNLCHFNHNVSWHGPVWIRLVWDCASWISVPFHKLGTFSTIISSSKVSAPTPSGASVTWIDVVLELSYTVPLSVTFSLFFCSAWVISHRNLCRSVPLHHLIYRWFILVFFFFFQLLCSSALFGSSLHLVTLLKSCCSPILLPSSLSTFMITALSFSW